MVQHIYSRHIASKNRFVLSALDSVQYSVQIVQKGTTLHLTVSIVHGHNTCNARTWAICSNMSRVTSYDSQRPKKVIYFMVSSGNHANKMQFEPYMQSLVQGSNVLISSFVVLCVGLKIDDD